MRNNKDSRIHCYAAAADVHITVPLVCSVYALVLLDAMPALLPAAYNEPLQIVSLLLVQLRVAVGCRD
jgi:hypothetical protein